MELYTIYLICAVAGGAVLAIRFVMMMIGMDGDVVPHDVDLDHDGIFDAGDGHGGGVTFLSMQSIAGFFTMFGLVGMGLLQVNAGTLWSLLGAITAGVFTAWCTGMIFLSMRRLQSDGTLVIENAIGKKGTVYLSVPEKGTGSVTVPVQGAMRTLDAVSEKGVRIPTGSLITVVGVAAGSILVVTEMVTETQPEPAQKASS
jgi:hypothetical protein